MLSCLWSLTRYKSYTADEADSKKKTSATLSPGRQALLTADNNDRDHNRFSRQRVSRRHIYPQAERTTAGKLHNPLIFSLAG